MPAERTTMRQVREVLRLKFLGVPTREIARRIGVAPSTVRALGHDAPDPRRWRQAVRRLRR
jgi:DNA-binding NarL/FixJ family response regulator